MRLQTNNQSLAVGLVTNNAWHWLGFAHTECFDLVFGDALSSQVRGNSSSATLGELLVVLLRTEAIRVTGHQNEFQFLHFFDARNDFAIKNSLTFRFQDGLVEVEQRF